LGYTFCIQIWGSSSATRYQFLRDTANGESEGHIYIRIIHEGKRIQCKPVYADKNQTRLKTLWAWGKGHHPEGEYYLRYAGKWEAVGNDPYVALDRLNERKEKLRRGARLSPAAAVVESLAESVPEVPSGVTVEAAIRDYLTSGKAAEKDWAQAHVAVLYPRTKTLPRILQENIFG
jgi:hypothetical protein